MATYNVEILLNDREDHGYFIYGYRAGDPLKTLGVYAFAGDDIHEVAEIIFRFGNLRDITAADGGTYPEVRSISKGDVLRFTAPDGTVTALACASFGWTELEPATVA